MNINEYWKHHTSVGIKFMILFGGIVGYIVSGLLFISMFRDPLDILSSIIMIFFTLGLSLGAHIAKSRACSTVLASIYFVISISTIAVLNSHSYRNYYYGKGLIAFFTIILLFIVASFILSCVGTYIFQYQFARFKSNLLQQEYYGNNGNFTNGNGYGNNNGYNPMNNNGYNNPMNNNGYGNPLNNNGYNNQMNNNGYGNPSNNGYGNPSSYNGYNNQMNNNGYNNPSNSNGYNYMNNNGYNNPAYMNGSNDSFGNNVYQNPVNDQNMNNREN